jgi:endonuclease/exonuclease/phosphatase family metal-dependent hydrolase
VVALTARIAKREHPDPYVVTGDFNDVESSASIAFLEGRGALPDQRGIRTVNPLAMIDTFRVRHPRARNLGTAHGFTGIRNGSRIDYVIAPRETEVRRADILRDAIGGQYPSDHFAVSVRLRLKR